MNIICKLLGHKIRPGHYGYGERYLDVTVGPVDGIDRVHADLHTECERCGTRFKVGKIHLPIVDDCIAELLKKSNVEKRFSEKYNREIKLP